MGNPSHQKAALKGQLKQISVNDLYTEDLDSKAATLLTSEIVDRSRHISLLTFPLSPSNDTHWEVPRIMWHTDTPRLANMGAPGVIALSYIIDVESSGGGTMVVTGSHRLYTTSNTKLASRNFKNKLKRHAFFRTLFDKSSERFA